MSSPPETSVNFTPKQVAVLLFSVFIIAFCGILYELLIGTLSTYFLGSSVLHFSVTIGLFMTFMGLGSWISRYIKEPILDKFIWIEWGLGIIGGFCALILYASF
jgi:spermidine synthase